MDVTDNDIAKISGILQSENFINPVVHNVEKWPSVF